MSRAYRITVKDSVRRVIRAEDCVQTQLQMLQILPCDQMNELLASELTKLGFERDRDHLVRINDDFRIDIDLEQGTVTVSVVKDEQVDVVSQKSGSVYDDRGKSERELRQDLRREVDAEIDQIVDRQQSALQSETTDRLESHLADLRQEIDQATNRATAEALKQKAKQLGQIKQLTEDPESGSLTIVVEL